MSNLRRAGVSEITTPLLTLEEDIAAYDAAGWGSIGVWLHKLERPQITEFWFPEERIGDATVTRAVRALGESSLSVSHLICGALYTDADPQRRASRIAHTVHALEVAEAIGSVCLVVIPGRLNGHTREQATALTVSALEEILGRTTTSNVLIGIEPVSQVDFVNTIDEALDLIDLLDHPRVGVYPDSFHASRVGSSGQRLAEEIARAAGRIVGVHLADAATGVDERVVVGEGILPLAEFVAQIEATGYRGSYDVEHEGSSERELDPYGVLERSARGVARILAEAGVT
jgi:sugar phosphate isomerase/epimerase